MPNRSLMLLALLCLAGCKTHKDWTANESTAFFETCYDKDGSDIYCAYEAKYTSKEVAKIAHNLHASIKDPEVLAFMHHVEDSCRAYAASIDSQLKATP